MKKLMLLITVFMLFIAFLGLGYDRQSVPMMPSNFWKGLMGEAVGEGYTGMYAVACVHRNRLKAGMTLGSNAYKRKDIDVFISKQPKKYSDMAKEIMLKVFKDNGKDITNGATHYENVETFGIPYWAKDMEVTKKIGNHTFYR